MQLSDYILQVQELVHDLAGNDFTTNELTNYINNARYRVNLDAHCTRFFIGNGVTFLGGSNVQLNIVSNQEIYPISGGIPGTIISNPGSGYVQGAAVTFQPPSGGGITATGTLNVGTNGVITSITMTNWGTNYPQGQSFPLIFPFTTGTAAAAVPFVLAGVIDIMSISYMWPGATNRQMLRWLPFTTFQAWCRAWVGQIGSPSAWTTNDQANLLFIFPVPDQAYIIEIDYVGTPVNLINPSDTDFGILPPYSDAVQFYAAYLARGKLQDYDKADYWRKAYNTRLREINATRQDRRIPNIYRSSARRLLRW